MEIILLPYMEILPYMVVFFMVEKPLFICKFLLGDRLRNQKIHLAPLQGV